MDATTQANDSKPAPEKPQTREAVDALVRQIAVKVLMLDNVTPESIDPLHENFLIDLGANSIDALEVIVTVEEKLGVEFNDQELNADLVKTLERFVDSICDKLSIPRPQRAAAAPSAGTAASA
ncbi:MAG: acyl carrier protein [Kofleriaceae bacterium]